MKPENKAIRDIFNMDGCLEWSIDFEDTFGKKGFMFAWSYEDIIKLSKKYPYLKEALALNCKAFEKIRFEQDDNVLEEEA